jgi:hypothetical protein
MLMYLQPSCPNHPFSIVLDDMEINTWIQGSLLMGPIRILALARSL